MAHPHDTNHSDSKTTHAHDNKSARNTKTTHDAKSAHETDHASHAKPHDDAVEAKDLESGAATAETTSFKSAFQATAGARAALTSDQLLIVNLDVPTAITEVLGAMPAIRALRPDVEHLVGFDLQQFDQLEPFTEALKIAHGNYLRATQPVADLPTLAARGVVVRDLLASDASALAKRGFFDGAPLANLRASTSFKTLAMDLDVVEGLLRENWTKIEGKSAVTLADLDEAASLSDKIFIALGERTNAPTVSAAADTRQRAYTLFWRAYDQARRAAIYLRWNQGDADTLVPSLYAGRGGRGKNPADPTPSPPATTPAQPGASAPATSQTLTPAPAAVPPGHAGGNPFTA